ncbi:MAG: STAS domain-containing protein [bacterium]
MASENYSQASHAAWLQEPTPANFAALVSSLHPCATPDQGSVVTFAAGPDATLICRFKGKMGSTAAQELEACRLAEVLKEVGASVVFDLKEVSFISSAFLRICLVTAKLKGEGNFYLVNPSSESHKVLNIAGLDKWVARSG